MTNPKFKGSHFLYDYKQFFKRPQPLPGADPSKGTGFVNSMQIMVNADPGHEKVIEI